MSNSYCAAPQHNFSKSYALTVDKLKEVLKFVKIDVKVDDERVMWNEDMDFMSGFDVIETNGKFLSEVYCNNKELKKQIKEFKDAKRYSEYCKANSTKEISNIHTYEG